MDYKIGDIIYTNNKYRWHDTVSFGEFHNIEKGSAFIITGLPKNAYSQNIEMISSQYGFEVLMSISHVYESFLSIKETRKIKIEKLNKIK